MSALIQYIRNVKNELLYKVSWPSYKDVQIDAIVVLISCIIISLVVFLVDEILGQTLIASLYSILY